MKVQKQRNVTSNWAIPVDENDQFDVSKGNRNHTMASQPNLLKQPTRTTTDALQRPSRP